MTTLKERRKLVDLIKIVATTSINVCFRAYKLLTQKQNVDYQQFFRKEEKQYCTGYEVIVPRCSFYSVTTNLRKSFFSHRALDILDRLVS